MIKFASIFSLCTIALALSGCVRVHHIQVASVNSTAQGFPVKVVIESLGVDAGKVAKNVEKINQVMKGHKRSNNKISDTIAMFQSGPKTGAPVYEESWGEQLLSRLLNKCPSAQLDNIYTQRLSTDYGDTGITREVVVVKATCLE